MNIEDFCKAIGAGLAYEGRIEEGKTFCNVMVRKYGVDAHIAMGGCSRNIFGRSESEPGSSPHFLDQAGEDLVKEIKGRTIFFQWGGSCEKFQVPTDLTWGFNPR